MLEAAAEETTVTDVGSTKASVVAAAAGSRALRRRPPDLRLRGARRRARVGRALRGRDVVPHADAADRARSATASCTASSPSSARCRSRSTRRAHDRLVALTSHLPHVLANVLVNQAGAARIEGHEPLANAGGSLRDMTRVAGANPRIWVDIFLDNAAAVRDALAEHRRRIEQVEAALDARRRGLPRALDRRGRAATAGGCSSSAYADAGALHRVRVHVPDRPGVLAGDHAGARRRADQHRGLRAAAHLARARRHADAARHRRGRGARAPPSCSRAGLRRRRLGGAR